ncbi:hypothetical protein [Rhizobium grahamii]|uniref:Uncharacterized protein n=1 Tax=Rhizobium grahamii CCGE 502 TaxID=990285 RepID=S3HBU5_9HYPH|nr:hypothetical protein [Rhizobium grahamii]EPE96162.1 hypothetical protein RGCCGE502_21315 [Rhizobium grahamii CCGE 502]
MSLATVPGKIRLYGSHAVLVMTEGSLHQTVCISDDALPADEGDVIQGILRYLPMYECIADRKFSEGQLAYDGRVWITSSDITSH